MMEFTLSKMNLLIFVTAIAAIVLFFMNTVSSNLRIRQSYELAYRVGEQIKSGVENNSYCSVKYVEIPDKIKINSGESYTYTKPYVLNISNFESPDRNKLIVSILDSSRKKIFAAYDLDYNGNVFFYDWEQDNSGSYVFSEVNNDNDFYNLDLNPIKKNSIDDRIVVAKKVINGKPNIYIFSCGYRNNIPGCSGTNNNFFRQLVDEEGISCLCMVPELAESSGVCYE